ncbi:MAG: sodium:proton antiporter [Candidatus Tritonobacter lacicola]|nr:sodium:proton antiporter [Candidatus Tritonobacter lacicola]
MSLYFLCAVLFAIGVYCILTKRNLIKIIIGVGIMEYSLNLLFILVAYRMNSRSPIIDEEWLSGALPPITDPLPQALVITSIVIGLATKALLICLAMRLYEKYGTFDITEIRRLKG